MQIHPNQLTYEFHAYDRFILRSLQARLIRRQGELAFHRVRRGMVQDPAHTLADRLAACSAWRAYHQSAHLLTLSDTCVVAQITLSRHAPHTSFEAAIWATGATHGERFIAQLADCIGPMQDAPATLAIDWVYRREHGHAVTPMLEQVHDTVHASAYPWLPGGLPTFAERFLATRAPVTVFHGLPGVGKTRLIRHLLALQSRRQSETLKVLYTADPEVFDRDGVFVDFMTGDHGALVVEDADHLLKPRTEGNRNLHRFLAASDGFIQPRGRRLIFSTNLPSRLDIDEALLRPGRCFACVQGQRLTPAQTNALLHDLGHATDAVAARLGGAAGGPPGPASLAEIYAAIDQIATAPHGPELPPLA